MTDETLRVCYVGPFASGRGSSLAALVGRCGDERSVRHTPQTISIVIDGHATKLEVFTNIHRGHVFYRGPADPTISPELAREIETVAKCDAFIMVVPCRTPRLEASEVALSSLREDLAAYGRSLDAIPVVFQLTQLDYDDAMAPDSVRAHLRTGLCDYVEADPRTGVGVREAVEALLRLHFQN